MDELDKLKQSLLMMSNQLLDVESFFRDIGIKGVDFYNFGKKWFEDVGKCVEKVKYYLNDLKREGVQLKSKMKDDIQANAFDISDLCSYLKIDPVQFSLDENLSLFDTLEALKNIVKLLEEKKIAVDLEEYKKMHKEFKSLIDEVRKNNYLTDDERKIYHMEVERQKHFPTEQTSKFISELKSLKVSNKNECIKLCASLKNILNRLNVPATEEPLVHLPDDSQVFIQCPTLEQLKNKLVHYQSIRKSKLKEIQERIRNEIRDIWEAGHFTEEFRMTCPIYYKDKTKGNLENNKDDDDDDDDDVKEREIMMLEEYLHRCKLISDRLVPLNEKLQAYDDAWRELEEVEVRLSDPDKFKNRGGKLLKDENLKKRILTILPKNESDIKKDIEDLKEEFGYEHGIDSSSFADSCVRRWHSYQEQKNGEVINRHRNKAEIMNHELRYGSKPAPVNKRHVAWNLPKTTDDIKKKSVPLKAHNPSTHKYALYGMGMARYESKESLSSQSSTLSSLVSSQNMPAACSTPVDPPSKRFKPD